MQAVLVDERTPSDFTRRIDPRARTGQKRSMLCNVLGHIGLRRALVTIALVSPCFVSGCGDDGEPTIGPSHPAGARDTVLGTVYSLRFDSQSGSLFLTRGSEILAHVPVAGWQLGRVSSVDPSFNYDPYPLLAPRALYSPPPGLVWIAPTAAQVTSSSDREVQVRLEYAEGATGELHIEFASEGRFRIHWQPPQGWPIAYFRLRLLAPDEQGFYGLGEYFDDVNHRGKLRALQIEFDPDIESLYNEAHVPIPLLIGARGWGVFVESYYPAVFDVQHSNADEVQTIFGTGEASASGLVVYLFAADSGLDVTRRYYETTGYPRLPPRWVLGPLVWRNENRDQWQFEGDLRTMRALDLPATGVWIDRPYATAVNSFDFDAERFPAPERMFALARRLGFRVALWHTPYLDSRAAATRALREHAMASGFYPPRTGLLFNPWGRPLDFTNPAAREWWQGLLGFYVQLGVAGFKLDYGEDVVVGLTSTRNRWLFADGSDERTMHARYQLFYHRTYAEVLPPEGGLLLVRHSTFGGQIFAPVVWPGDLDASFARHREAVNENGERYVAVGGLPAAVIAGSGLGPSGFPLFASDTGGYRHAPPDKELFTRWFQHTALSPAMQIGTSSNDVAWEPTAANGFDDAMLEWYRTYTRLHLRLFPYLWTYLQQLLSDGRAIQRPFGLAYPHLGVHPWDQYCLGDALLVAPIVDRGTRERTVVFPEGDWIEWWSQRMYSGPGSHTVPAPLEHIPFFLRRGAIVPLLRPTIDTLVPTEDPQSVDSYATTPGILYARLFPGGSTKFALFDGSLLSQTLESNGPNPTALRVAYRPGEEFRHGAVAECVGLPQLTIARVTFGNQTIPPSTTLEGLEQVPVGWLRDTDALWVRLPPDGGEIRVQFARSPRE